MALDSRPFRLPAPLYPIIDFETAGAAGTLAEAVLAAGAPLLQLRFKHGSTVAFLDIARVLRRLARSHGALFIVNDRADVALAVDADGVHLGQDDLPPGEARRLVGPDKIIGWSTHSIAQVRAAEASAVLDYIGFGPVFATATKENPDPVQGIDGVGEARRHTRLPIVGIGGITARTAPTVLSAGADAVAMIGELAHADDPAALTATLLRLPRR